MFQFHNISQHWHNTVQTDYRSKVIWFNSTRIIIIHVLIRIFFIINTIWINNFLIKLITIFIIWSIA